MKKMLVLFAFMLLASISQAGYLYWQVSTSDSNIDKWTGGEYDDFAVRVVAANSADYHAATEKITLSDPENGDLSGITDDNTPWSLDLGELSGTSYYFFVELYKWDGDSDYVGVSDDNGQVVSKGASYSDLLNAGMILEEGEPGVYEAYWTDSWAVPEPTSGVMALLGVAFLALRRKRQTA